MVISLQKTKKVIAVLLAAAVILSAVCLGINAVKESLYPKNYSDYVERYADEYNIDINLVYAVIHTESGFDSQAVSGMGACGLMQLMPDTFEWLQSKNKPDGEENEDIFDPETNIRYGIYFLSLLTGEFDNETLVVAAYHAGMGRVNQWLSDENLSPDGKTLSSIPFSDTEHYVKKVERTKKVYETLY